MIKTLSPLVRGMSMILWFLVYLFCVLSATFPIMPCLFQCLSPSFQCLYPAHSCYQLCFFSRFHWASESYNPPACLSALCFHHRPDLSGLRALCIIMPVCDVCWMLNCFELNTRMLCYEWFISLQSAWAYYNSLRDLWATLIYLVSSLVGQICQMLVSTDMQSGFVTDTSTPPRLPLACPFFSRVKSF